MKPISAIILAAGKGTRLAEGNPSPKPKVLYEIAGRPFQCFVRESPTAAIAGDRPDAALRPMLKFEAESV